MTVPSRTGINPNSAFSIVDLPAPLGPMMPISSPSASSRLQPLRMLTSGTYPAMTWSTWTSSDAPAGSRAGRSSLIAGLSELFERPGLGLQRGDLGGLELGRLREAGFDLLHRRGRGR